LLSSERSCSTTSRTTRFTRWWKAGQDNVLNVTKRQYDVLMRSELARSAASRQLLEAIQMYGYINDETNQVVVALDNSRFVNHSDTPNSDCAPEDPNNQAMANRDILPGEELGGLANPPPEPPCLCS
jgi:hypothetical protein